MTHLLLELLRRSRIHVRRHRTRIDSIDSSPLGEFTSPSPSHGLQRSFRAAVDTLPLEAERGADAADVDDAAGAVVREVRARGFHEEERAADIDVVEESEVVAVALFDGEVAGDAGVVDDDVDLQLAGLGVREVVLGHLDEVRGAVLGAHVCLDGQAFDAVGVLQLLGELLGLVGRGLGCVVDHETCAFAGEVFTCRCANATRATSHDCYLALEHTRRAACEISGS